MLKRLFGIAGFLLLATASVFGQTDPRDSVILESKTVYPWAYPGSASDTAAYVYLKVYITNKDSLTAIAVSLKETSVSGGAYMTLARPRDFNGVVNRLTNTLNGSLIFTGQRYHSNSPDSFLVEGVFDPQNPSSIEAPNNSRKAFWEIKFDSVLGNLGAIEFDTAMVVQNTGFVNTFPYDIPVNFLKSVVTVINPPKGDLNLDGVLTSADAVRIAEYVFLGNVPPAGAAACDLNCDGEAAPADLVLELLAVYRSRPFPC